MTEDEFAELLAIVDAAAGRTHSRGGSVAMTLRAVLARYDEMRASQDPTPGLTCARIGHRLRRVRPWWPPFAQRRVRCARCPFEVVEPLWTSE